MAMRFKLQSFLGLLLLSILLTVQFPSLAQASLACNRLLEGNGSGISSSNKHLRELEAYLQEYPNHELIDDGNTKTLKIGLLSKAEKKFALLAYKAIREGSIQNIEAGAIIGPKVLPLLSHLVETAIQHNLILRIYGNLSPAVLQKNYLYQINRVTPKQSLRYWLPHEIESYDKARALFRIEECLHPNCSFELTVEAQQMKISYTKFTAE